MFGGFFSGKGTVAPAEDRAAARSATATASPAHVPTAAIGSLASPTPPAAASAFTGSGGSDDSGGGGSDTRSPVNRFFSEGGAGLRGYLRNLAYAPSMEISPEVASQPERVHFHKRLTALPPNVSHNRDQLIHQNNSQAQAGNRMTVEAADVMADRLASLASATSIGEASAAHAGMQMDSLGPGRFDTAAPHLLHRLALPVQQPLIALRSAVLGPEEAMSSNYRPLTTVTRAISSKLGGGGPGTGGSSDGTTRL